MPTAFLKWILLTNISCLAISKEKIEPATPEGKHGLLHEPNILYNS